MPSLGKKGAANETFAALPAKLVPRLHEPLGFLQEESRIRMHPRGPLAINQFPVDGELENSPAGGNEFKGFDLVFILAQQSPGNAESPFEVPSSRAVFQLYPHHGSRPPALGFSCFAILSHYEDE